MEKPIEQLIAEILAHRSGPVYIHPDDLARIKAHYADQVRSAEQQTISADMMIQNIPVHANAWIAAGTTYNPTPREQPTLNRWEWEKLYRGEWHDAT